MEKVEKVLLLAVLGVALMIVAVMSFLPEDVKADVKREGGEAAARRDAPTERAEPSTPRRDPAAGPIEGPGTTDGSAGPTLADLMGETAPKPGPEAVQAPRELNVSDAGGESEVAAKHGGAERATAGTEAAGAGRDTGSRRPTGEGVAKDETGEGRVESPAPVARTAMQYTENPDYLLYVVQAGDTLGQIVQDVCGTTEVIDEVLAVNEELRANPNAIAAGYRLIIPKVAIRPISVRPEPETPPIVARSAPARAPANAQGPTPEVYTVQPGDSLWRIAAQHVGAKRATAFVARLQELNPKARGTIKPGMKLRLPAR